MAAQVQSLATEIAQLRLLSPAGPRTTAIFTSSLHCNYRSSPIADSLLQLQIPFNNLLHHLNHHPLRFNSMVLNTEDLNAMNDQDAEDLNTPVTITKGELAQLSLAFNSCNAMATSGSDLGALHGRDFVSAPNSAFSF